MCVCVCVGMRASVHVCGNMAQLLLYLMAVPLHQISHA